MRPMWQAITGRLPIQLITVHDVGRLCWLNHYSTSLGILSEWSDYNYNLDAHSHSQVGTSSLFHILQTPSAWHTACRIVDLMCGNRYPGWQDISTMFPTENPTAVLSPIMLWRTNGRRQPSTQECDHLFTNRCKFSVLGSFSSLKDWEQLLTKDKDVIANGFKQIINQYKCIVIILNSFKSG